MKKGKKLIVRQSKSEKTAGKTARGDSGRRASQKVSKKAIRILTEQDDLLELFTGEKSGGKSRENFSEMLEQSLSDNHVQTFIDEKNDNISPKPPLTTIQTIKKYPAPQDELDLHGYTAAEAERKAESFIRNARQNGLQTLRIIVGKGLHSEGRAVLPDVIEDKVVLLKKSKLVLTFTWESHAKRKSGAMIVYLTFPTADG